MATNKQKFTYKKQPRETGLRAVGHTNPSTDIKLNGGKVGIIGAPDWTTKDGKWSIRFTIKHGEEMTPEFIKRNGNVEWKWVTLNFRGESEQACRDWIAAKSDELFKRFTFHSLEY